MVVGSLRAWRTAPGAWTAAIAVVLTTTLNSVLSMVLPRSFGYGTHGMGLVLATGVYAVMAVLSLAIPMLLLRARLGPRRDREGLIDASAIAAAVGIVRWDALVLSAPGADLTSVTMLAAPALAVAPRTSFR
jgi:hypothetical protein